MRRANDALVVALYTEGRTWRQIEKETGHHKSTIKAILRRNNVQMRGSPALNKPIKQDVIRLAREGKDAHEIAAEVGSSFNSVSTILTNLRRRGVIGIYDGRVRRTKDGNLEGVTPLPEIHLELDYETRSLLDGEAADLNEAPASIACRILKSVLADQELLETALYKGA